MLTDEQVKKFQVLYKNRFGKEIGKDEAYEKGVGLVRLVEVVYKPKNLTRKYEEHTKKI